MASNNQKYVTLGGPNTGRHSVLETIRRDPRLAAGASKLLAPNRTRATRTLDSNAMPPSTNSLRDTSNRLIDDQRDSRNIINMMPDIEMSMRLLVAAIMNPKDLTTIELNYKAPDTRMDPLLTNGLIDLIRAYFEDGHKIKPQLPNILKNALFLKGAHPIAILPENTLDAIINAPSAISMESLNAVLGVDNSLKTVGALGPSTAQLEKLKKENKRAPTLRERLMGTTRISLEECAMSDGSHRHLNIPAVRKPSAPNEIEHEAIVDSYVSFHDNPDILKLPIVYDRLAKAAMEKAYYPAPALETASDSLEGLSLEDISHANEFRRMTLNEAERILYKKRNLQMRSQVIAPTQAQLSRASVSEPLIMDLPYEAVFPVFMPGEEHKHVAYMVLIDPMTGGFVTDRYTDQQVGEMAQMNNPSTGSFSSSMISRINRLGTNDTQGLGMHDYFTSHIDYCYRVYGEMIEADFVDRVANGPIGRKVTLGDVQDLGRIMLARRLAEQSTQVLFLPRELMSYFAFNYRKDGLGESLIEQIKPMLAMRMALMMANLLGQLKNSVGRTRIRGTIDEDDADPLETREKIIDEVIRSRQMFANFPARVQGPMDVLNYLAASGIEFSWEEHPRLPNVKLDVEYFNTDHTLPSTDLEEEYKKRTILKFGVPPEQVDAALGPDFAVQAINSNVMLAKQVLQQQMEFAAQLTQHMVKIIRTTPSIHGEMIALVARNVEKHVQLENVTDPTKLTPKIKQEIATNLVRQFLDGLTVELPAPNSITHRNQLEAMSDFEELLDKGITYTINAEFLTEDVIGTNLSDRVDLMASSIKAVKMREYMARNGILPELAEIGLTDSDGRSHSIYEAQVAHARQLMEGFTKMFAKIRDPKAATDARLERDAGFDESDTGSTSSDSGSTEPPEGMEDSFGGDMPSLDESTLPPEDNAGGNDEQNTNADNAGEDQGSEGTDNANTGEDANSPAE